MIEVEVERRHALDPRQRRRAGPGANVDKVALGRQLARLAAVHTQGDRLGAAEAGLAHQQIQALDALGAALAAAAEALDDIALALAHFRHIELIGPVPTP